MKTLNEKLEKAINGTRGNIRNSLNQLLKNGFTRTGKNQSRKTSCWTNGVVKILKDNKIPYNNGNDAVRGGIAGEFVQLTSKSQLAQIKAAQQVEKNNILKKEAILNEKKINKRFDVIKFIEENQVMVNEKLSELSELKANGNQSEWHVKANALVQIVTKNDFQHISWSDVYSILKGK